MKLEIETEEFKKELTDYLVLYQDKVINQGTKELSKEETERFINNFLNSLALNQQKVKRIKQIENTTGVPAEIVTLLKNTNYGKKKMALNVSRMLILQNKYPQYFE